MFIEEYRGLILCIVIEYNFFYIFDDVMWFLYFDNYWCFLFERVVWRYVIIKFNFKNIECIYVKKEV